MAKRVGARSEDWWANQPPHVIRCSGQKPSTGERCRREAIPGGSVCRIHGGALPAVQAKAATRIGMTVDAAVTAMQEMLADPNTDNRDKIIIAKDILDRGGLGATNKLLVGIGQVDPVERLFMDILGSSDGLADPVRAEAERAALPASSTYQGEGEDSPLLHWEEDASGLEDVVDAEIVEERPERTHEHTVHIGAMPKTPPHIREALERLL
jgi:hypothetical protein